MYVCVVWSVFIAICWVMTKCPTDIVFLEAQQTHLVFRYADIGMTTITYPATDVAAMCLSLWPAALYADRVSVAIAIHVLTS